MANLLIVHADQLMQGLLELAFRRAGHTAECAADADEALCRLRRPAAALPDALVVQLELPGEDGVALALKVRHLPGAERLPVLLIMDVPDHGGHGRVAAAALSRAALYDGMDRPAGASGALARLLSDST